MPRNREEEEVDEQPPQHVDWEPDGEMVPKIVKTLRMKTVHEALLILAAASTEIMKAASGNWDEEKVKELSEL